MKILSRDFTLVEKLLFIILGVVLTGLLYYQFVYVPVARELETTAEEREQLSSELLIVQGQLSRLESMEAELERYERNRNVSRMPSYNNSNKELALFNNTLRGIPYTVSFVPPLGEDGNQIRRNFNIQFAVNDFASAKRIVTSLAHGEYRCLLSSLNYSVNSNTDLSGRVIVRLELTFYETMVDGTPDIGLPSVNGNRR